MSNKFNGVGYDSSKQQCGPGESPSYDAIGAAYAAVSSRYSPEGIDEVLESAQRETASEAARERAKHAADTLDAWVRGETLEWRDLVSERWREYEDSLYMPNVTSPGLEWRVKRTPRKVWLAFHEGGSIADIRALEPDDNPGGRAYFEFEEKLS